MTIRSNPENDAVTGVGGCIVLIGGIHVII